MLVVQLQLSLSIVFFICSSANYIQFICLRKEPSGLRDVIGTGREYNSSVPGSTDVSHILCPSVTTLVSRATVVCTKRKAMFKLTAENLYPGSRA